jgi:hypothetical protein
MNIEQCRPLIYKGSLTIFLKIKDEKKKSDGKGLKHPWMLLHCIMVNDRDIK